MFIKVNGENWKVAHSSVGIIFNTRGKIALLVGEYVLLYVIKEISEFNELRRLERLTPNNL